MAMKKGRCNVVGFTLAFVLLIFGGMVGCKQESDSSVCKCPNGTNHYPNDCTCGADDCNCINEQVNNQTATITLTFGTVETTATVKGELTDTQWDGLAQRLQTAIQAGYDDSRAIGKGNFGSVFGNAEAVIIVEKTSAFDNWSISNRYLISFNLDYLRSLNNDELMESIKLAVADMNSAPEPEGDTKVPGTKIIRENPTPRH